MMLLQKCLHKQATQNETVHAAMTLPHRASCCCDTLKSILEASTSWALYTPYVRKAKEGKSTAWCSRVLDDHAKGLASSTILAESPGQPNGAFALCLPFPE